MTRGTLRIFLLMVFAGAVLGLAGGLILGGDAAPSASAPPGTATDEVDSSQGPMTPERAREIGANELGTILVLEYHLIGGPTTDDMRTPDEFRDDVELLKEEGFYPINVRDLATGNIEIPVGKSPVVITFDDSSPGQYRILDDQTIDPDSAVGILEKAVRDGDWASRASFYVLLDVRPDDHILFGQPDYEEQKLQSLVGWGYEVGGHTMTHLDMSEASSDIIAEELATSNQTIEKMIGGDYRVVTLSVPFGRYPEDESLLQAGSWNDISYSYAAVVGPNGGPAPSPFSTTFDALHIPRIDVQGDALREAIRAYKEDEATRYVSDGDPAAVSVPAVTAEELGALRDDLGRPVVTY
jgi:hypothetical protein